MMNPIRYFYSNNSNLFLVIHGDPMTSRPRPYVFAPPSPSSRASWSPPCRRSCCAGRAAPATPRRGRWKREPRHGALTRDLWDTMG